MCVFMCVIKCVGDKKRICSLNVSCLCFCFAYQALEYLPFEGTVSLKNPQHVFCLLEDYGTDPNNIPEHPEYIYFGRWVSYIYLFFCILI